MPRDSTARLTYSIPPGFREVSDPNSPWRVLKHPDLEGEIRFRFQVLAGRPSQVKQAQKNRTALESLALKQTKNLFSAFEFTDRPSYAKAGPGILIPREGKGYIGGRAGEAEVNLLLFPETVAVVTANEDKPPGKVTELQVRAMQLLTSIEPEDIEPESVDIEDRLIFLSYNSADKELVWPISDILKDNGFDVWIDKENLAVGSMFAPKIDQALREADIMILVLSERGLGRWQKAEYAYGVGKALNKKMLFIPFALSERVDWPPLASTFNGIMPPSGVHDLVDRLKAG